MDSMSHTRVGNLLLRYTEQTTGVVFDHKSFLYGNLKPDLTGTYFTKRHYPSLRFEEVMQMIRDFSGAERLGMDNGRTVSVDLGEICHFLTDFFCYPHNDDIYPYGLMRHYIYEKYMTVKVRRRLNWSNFLRWAEEAPALNTIEDVIEYIRAEHADYHALEKHSIMDDVERICRICVTVVIGLIRVSGVRTKRTPCMA